MNVAEKALKVYSKLLESGFNGLETNFCDKECIWHQEYAIFRCEFHIPYNWNEHPSPYLKSEFDYFRFETDFLEYLKSEFPLCKVNFNRNTYEVEIIGPNHSEFHNKYQDQIEVLADKSGDWQIFTP